MRAERLLLLTLGLTVIDTGYLTWRYLALEGGWVTPGTGLCSWTAGIDCDRVLQTAQARAFYVPNAILGLGFFLGCAIWWLVGARLGPAYRRAVAAALAFWLAVATGFTLWFWWLLLHLDWLCPFCPWNHLLTWIALGAAVQVWRRAPVRAAGAQPLARAPIVLLVLVCVGQLVLWNALWIALRAPLHQPS